MSTSIAAFEISHDRGFLPADDPLRRLPNAFEDWEQVGTLLPKLLASDRLHHAIAELPRFPVEALRDPRARERAMVLLSYLGQAYVWGGPQPELILPQRLAMPWYEVAETLGRPPILSYSSYALHNFFRLEKSAEIECGNLGLIQNFLGGIDEEWFILVHVDIERKAAPAVAVLYDCLDAVEARDAERLELLLSRVASSLEAMFATLSRMPEHCDPYIYYHRVRPYIHGWKNHPDIPNGIVYEGVHAYAGQPRQFRGETGAQSAIVPSLDAMLGISHKEDLLSSYLREMRAYMPPAHRAFIESLEHRAPARPFVEASGRKPLIDVFNACVEILNAFRSLHLEYAASYIFRQAETDAKNPHAVGTGGTPFMEYLKKHRDETAGHLIAQR